jgi:putative PIN family toxin of toxin-antitoxin system
VPPRKDRIPVVFDTNVLVGYYLSKAVRSASIRIFRLWRYERKLQLIVSDEVVAEYFEILARTGVPAQRVKRLRDQIAATSIVTHVNLGARYNISRDPDDNVMLATAAAGKAEYLITNDYDLLDIAEQDKKRFKFEILKPATFLAKFES